MQREMDVGFRNKQQRLVFLYTDHRFLWPSRTIG